MKKFLPKLFINFLEAKNTFRKFLSEFNSQSKIVQLFPWYLGDVEHIWEENGNLYWNFKFQIRFVFPKESIYIKKKPYKEGVAIIYLSKNFYKKINQLSNKYFKVETDWNSNWTIGFLRGRND